VADWPGRFPWLLLLLGASWGADTGAIFAGKFFGRTLICPRLSPKKTLEGLLGGALAAGLIYVGSGLLYSGAAGWLSLTAQPDIAGLALLFLLGVALSLLGFFGDLVFSLYKRTARRKDYGAVIPGHGGVLDRFDSMVFVAPGLFLLCWALA
jgi:phosphatidate cytidylyltransferase